MQKTRIIVVDDDPITCRLVAACFAQDDDIEVRTCHSAGEALQCLALHPRIDRLLVDWNMPEMNGYELVRKVRSNRRWDNLRILMLTVETSPGHIREALAAGADEYLMKPFTREMLLSKLALLDLA